MSSKMGAPLELSEADNIVAEMRREFNISQVQLAKWLSTTARAVDYWESGERKISGPVTTLCKILRKYPNILETLD